MRPQVQPLSSPPDDGFRRLVGVATPDPAPEFTITSFGKNRTLPVVLGFRQVSEMDGGREISGGVAVEVANSINSRTGKVLLAIGSMLQKAGVEVSGEPPQFVAVPDPERTHLFLEPNNKYRDSATVLNLCRQMFLRMSQADEPTVSIPIRPDIHRTPEWKGLLPGARYDLESGKTTTTEERRAAVAKVLSLPVVGKMVDALKLDPEFSGAGWGVRVWGQVQVSAFRALKDVASRQKSAAVSLGSFLDELDNISSVPKMTLPQRNVLMVTYSELANQIERAGLT